MRGQSRIVASVVVSAILILSMVGAAVALPGIQSPLDNAGDQQSHGDSTTLSQSDSTPQPEWAAPFTVTEFRSWLFDQFISGLSNGEFPGLDFDDRHSGLEESEDSDRGEEDAPMPPTDSNDSTSGSTDGGHSSGASDGDDDSGADTGDDTGADDEDTPSDGVSDTSEDSTDDSDSDESEDSTDDSDSDEADEGTDESPVDDGYDEVEDTDDGDSDGSSDGEQPEGSDSDDADEGALDWSLVERHAHEAVNEERIAHGVDPIAFDTELRDIARDHSQDMAERGYFAHVDPDENNFVDRYDAAGYECRVPMENGYYSLGGENLAQTWYDHPVATADGTVQYTTEQELGYGVVEMWMNSDGHRDNMLTSHWQNQGIGIYVTEDGKVFATQKFC